MRTTIRHESVRRRAASLVSGRRSQDYEAVVGGSRARGECIPWKHEGDATHDNLDSRSNSRIRLYVEESLREYVSSYVLRPSVEIELR